MDEAVLEGKKILLRHSRIYLDLTKNHIVLPKGAQLLSSEKAGSSDWTITTCLSVLLPDKSTKRFFLKVCDRSHARHVHLPTLF
jgi:hypothetical protein